MNNIRKYKKESFLYLTLVTVFLLALTVVFWNRLFTNPSLLYWTLGIISFLFIYELATIILVNKQSKTTRPQQLVTLYMILKGAKIFLFLGVLIIYMLVVKEEAKRLILVAVALYFIYLLLDTLFLSWVEKGIKIQKSKDK
ncbi:MAG: hypothetical protein LIO93_06770 [Bacteroidales bacterium]|nr:hypothetical protein [Bacteroidales bacterium]